MPMLTFKWRCIMSSNDIFNILAAILFGTIGIVMAVRYFRTSQKILIEDKRWSFIRVGFLVIGVLSIINMFLVNNTSLDYIRMAATVICVTAVMGARDGIGDEGVCVGGTCYPWAEVRGYDYEDKESGLTVFFTLQPQNMKKPDQYKTKPIEFEKEKKEVVQEFLRINHKRKYMRMKKKL